MEAGTTLSEAFRRVSAPYARLTRLDLRSTGVSFWNLLFASFSPNVFLEHLGWRHLVFSFIYPTRVREARANTIHTGF